MVPSMPPTAPPEDAAAAAGGPAAAGSSESIGAEGIGDEGVGDNAGEDENEGEGEGEDEGKGEAGAGGDTRRAVGARVLGVSAAATPRVRITCGDSGTRMSLGEGARTGGGGSGLSGQRTCTRHVCVYANVCMCIRRTYINTYTSDM